VKLLYNRPALLMTLTCLFWSGNFVIGRGIVGAVPPATLACLRWLLAFLLFLPFAWTHLRNDAAEIARHWRIVLFLGFMGAGCYNTLSYLGLLWTEALNGLVVNSSGPLFIAVTAWALFGDRVDAAELIGMGLGFTGVIVTVVKGDLASLASFEFNPGDLLIVLALLTWSIYTAFLRKRPKVNWWSLNLSFFIIAVFCNLPFALIEAELGLGIHASWRTAAAVAYIVIFPSIIGYIFYNRAVELIGPARAGLFLFLVPVSGALLAMLFLGERLHLYHALGFVLIVAGVLIGSRKPETARRPKEGPSTA